jgi:hypothetical protein
VKDGLPAGRTPRLQADGFAVRDLLNHFLTAKSRLLDTREISNRTFLDYHATCDRISSAFGKTRLVDDMAAEILRPISRLPKKSAEHGPKTERDATRQIVPIGVQTDETPCKGSRKEDTIAGLEAQGAADGRRRD